MKVILKVAFGRDVFLFFLQSPLDVKVGNLPPSSSSSSEPPANVTGRIHLLLAAGGHQGAPFGGHQGAPWCPFGGHQGALPAQAGVRTESLEIRMENLAACETEKDKRFMKPYE